MADWKILATVIIVLGFLLLLTASEPSVKRFFNSFLGTVTPADENIERNVTFVLQTDTYPKITRTVELVNITLTPVNFSANLDYGSINSENEFDIINYKGKLILENDILSLDGEFEKIQIKDSGSFAKSRIKTDIKFTNLKLHLFSMDEIKFTTTGKVSVDGEEQSFANREIDITYPIGDFYFEKTMRIEGIAEKVIV